MRFLLAASAAVLAVTAAQVNAQDPGDPVTYTTGEVVYTAVLDPELDTVSAVAVSTIAADAGVGAGADVLSTTTDYYGNPVTISDGVTLGPFITGPTTAPVAAATTTQANPAGGVSIGPKATISATSDKISDNQQSDNSIPSEYLHFQSLQRRSFISPPDQPQDDVQALRKRQAALGGGGAAQTTQAGLQTISGYDPPADTAAPSPTNYSSGSILVPSQIPGYTGKENSQGVTSGSVRLSVGKTTIGALIGAVIFALA